MGIAQNCQIPARRLKNGPPSGQTATYRKTEVIQSYLRIWGTYDPIESDPSVPKKGGLYGCSVKKNRFCKYSQIWSFLGWHCGKNMHLCKKVQHIWFVMGPNFQKKIMSTIRPQGVLRRCKLYVGYQIYTVKSKKCNFETPKKWTKWPIEALNHIFYFNLGLNCPTEEESQFSIFSPNTPLRDHCTVVLNGGQGGGNH